MDLLGYTVQNTNFFFYFQGLFAPERFIQMVLRRSFGEKKEK